MSMIYMVIWSSGSIVALHQPYLQACWDRAIATWVLTSPMKNLCLAEGQNTVEVAMETRTSCSSLVLYCLLDKSHQDNMTVCLIYTPLSPTFI